MPSGEGTSLSKKYITTGSSPVQTATPFLKGMQMTTEMPRLSGFNRAATDELERMSNTERIRRLERETGVLADQLVAMILVVEKIANYLAKEKKNDMDY